MRLLSQLIQAAGLRDAELDSRAAGAAISTLTDDSRAVRPGACFVAVHGTKADGAAYVADAVRAGAVAVVTDRAACLPADAARSTTVVRVADAREALAKLAAAYHGVHAVGPKALSLIGITGTNGKTTTAWMIRSILAAAGHKAALLGTVVYDLVAQQRKAPLTTPGALELCRLLAEAHDAGATHAVLEVSSHALDQRRTDGLAFDAGVFTNLSGDHLDYHGTMQQYAEAKRRLFTGLGRAAAAVVNAEDPAGAQMLAGCAARPVRYGLEADADVTARVLEATSRRTRFLVQADGSSFEVSTTLVGRHNVMNATCAAATALALGVDPAALAAGLESLGQVPGRLERVEPDGWPFSVLVDYAHTDDALRRVLQVTREIATGRVICVFGCGGDRDRTKRPRMAAAVEELAHIAIVTSDNPRTEDPNAIIAEILPGFGRTPRCRVVVEPDRRSAIETAMATARPGDVVLIAGKGHEDYQLIGGKTLHFDDREVARDCVQALSGVAEDAA